MCAFVCMHVHACVCVAEKVTGGFIYVVMTLSSLPRHPAHSQTNIPASDGTFPLGVPDTSNQKAPAGKSLYPFMCQYVAVSSTQVPKPETQASRSTPLSLTPRTHTSPADCCSVSQSWTFPSLITPAMLVLRMSLLLSWVASSLWTVGIIVPASLGGCEKWTNKHKATISFIKNPPIQCFVCALFPDLCLVLMSQSKYFVGLWSNRGNTWKLR